MSVSVYVHIHLYLTHLIRVFLTHISHTYIHTYIQVNVTGRWFASENSTQTLHCDYVSTMKPRKGTLPMTDQRLERIVETLQLRDMRVIWNQLTRFKYEFAKSQYNEWGYEAREASVGVVEEGDEDEPLDSSTSNKSWNGEVEEQTSRQSFGPPKRIQRSSTIGHKASSAFDTSAIQRSFKGHKADSAPITFATVVSGKRDLGAVGSRPGLGPRLSQGRLQQRTIFTQVTPGFHLNLDDFPQLEPEPPLTVCSV
jgi:hypothetical protein